MALAMAGGEGDRVVRDSGGIGWRKERGVEMENRCGRGLWEWKFRGMAVREGEGQW